MALSRTMVVAGISGLALCAVDMASAQTSAAQVEDRSAEDGVQDIVVTAQRRDQRQQDVPIAISTVTGDTAADAGVITTEALGNLVPSLQFSRQTSNGGAPFIRGVGSANAATGAESPVAVYVDDVYIGSPASTTTLLNNIERVEVLKGPQGTLFGRNATGGVVSIRTKRPSQETQLDASIGYGNYDTLDANIYATGPISDTVAVNFAGTYHNQADGYGLNVNTGKDVYYSKSYAARAELLWEPSVDTSLLLIADYAREKGDAGLNVTIFPGTVAVGGQTFPGRYRATQVPGDYGINKQWGVSARLDQDLGFARLASITAYRKGNNFFEIDNDGSVVDFLTSIADTQVKSFSQEVQLLSPAASKIQWIGGLIYYYADAGFLPLVARGASQAGNGGSNTLVSEQKLNTFAGFGEINLPLTDATKLTLGLRYTVDQFDLDATRRNASGALIGGYPLSESDSFSKLTYRAVVDHHFTPDVMAYASYSRGFKSGGYNVQAPTIVVGGLPITAAPVAPEIIDAFEVGLKMDLFGRKLRLNPSLYYYDYSNLQVTQVGNGISTAVNAASAIIKGADIDFEAAPTNRLRFSGGISFLDAEFSSFPNGPFLVPNPAVCTPAPQSTGAPTGGNLTCQANLKGYRTPRSPKFTGSFNASYTLPTTVGAFTLTGSVYHNSGFTWDADNQVRQPKYTLLSSTLGWMSEDEKYEVKVWGRNLGNAYYFNYAARSGTRDSGQPAMPRSYGVTFGVHF